MSLLLLFQGPIDLPPAPPEVVYGVYADALLALTGEGARAMVAGDESERTLQGKDAATSIDGDGGGAGVGGPGGKTAIH